MVLATTSKSKDYENKVKRMKESNLSKQTYWVFRKKTFDRSSMCKRNSYLPKTQWPFVTQAITGLL